MKLRRYLLLIWLFACFVFSGHAQQQEPNTMVLHHWQGDTARIGMADIDSITFPHLMTVHLHNGAVRTFDTELLEFIDFVCLTADESEAGIDLGLSVRWASCNIGATCPEDYGAFFAWGEVEPKDDYSEATYAYATQSGYELIGTNICGTKYDAARHALGADWRLPTRSEMAELTSKCTWTAQTLNGISGYRVTGPNGNSIFLPAAGYQDGTQRKEVGTGGFYWSGNVDRAMISAAYNLNFRGYDAQWSACRAYGFSVRAVR